MFETSGFGQGFDGCEIPLGEITPEDVTQIVEDLVPRVDEELPLCLEITQLHSIPKLQHYQRKSHLQSRVKN